MGEVYKRKKRSCALCKPHKTGGADRLTSRQRFLKSQSQEEIDEAVAAFKDPHYYDLDDFYYDENIRSEYDEERNWFEWQYIWDDHSEGYY